MFIDTKNAGGAAQFFNSLVKQLAHKLYHNRCIYHAFKAREVGVSDLEVLFTRVKQVRILIACAEHVRLLIACVKHFRGASHFLINWGVLEKKMCEVVCMVELVWGLVTKKNLRLGKCFESFVNTSIFSSSSRMSKASLVSKPSIIFKLNLVCQIIINQITNLYIRASIMLSLTIYLALLCQNIESNPGPLRPENTTLSILTYNCNGLGDPKKLKKLLLKVNVLVNRGCIVFQKRILLTPNILR